MRLTAGSYFGIPNPAYPFHVLLGIKTGISLPLMHWKYLARAYLLFQKRFDSNRPKAWCSNITWKMATGWLQMGVLSGYPYPPFSSDRQVDLVQSMTSFPSKKTINLYEK